MDAILAVYPLFAIRLQSNLNYLPNLNISINNPINQSFIEPNDGLLATLVDIHQQYTKIQHV